ncbi:flippase-like domain-containing protein [Candidatus Saccharibacteria bacterium]|nr:flippase-like domain-containing protein [Candidatus Saccharibacteria bacterium]
MENPSSKTKTTNWRKRILIIVFVLFNAAVILWTALSEFGSKENAARLSSVNLNGWLLIPALLCFVLGISAEIFKYFLMMKRCCHLKDWRTAARVVLLGRYYDNITPAAVGGQPFQIYYMNKRGLKKGYDATIPIIGMISTQIGFLIVAIFSFVVLGHYLSIGLLGSGYLGLMFYAIFPIAIIGATFFPGIVSKIVAWSVKLLAKIHIIKNRKATIEKTEEKLNDYANCVRTILKDKKLSLAIVGCSVLFQICISAIPFFVLRAFGGELNFFSCFVTILAITSTIYFVPTPGNAGAAEGSFFFVFSNLTSGYVFWAMLFWRFFSYYSYILMGVIIYSFMAYEKRTGRYFTSDAKRWLKKQAKKLRKR